MEEAEWEKWSKELEQRISKWLEEESIKKEDGYYCKQCGEHLMQRTVYCSIHDGWKYFKSHSGFGKVHKFPIPECPNKDCANHRPSFWDRHLVLDAHSDTLRGPCIDC